MINRSATATIKGYFYQFDQTIVRLLEDDGVWRRQSHEGARYAAARFSRAALREQMEKAMDGGAS